LRSSPASSTVTGDAGPLGNWIPGPTKPPAPGPPQGVVARGTRSDQSGGWNRVVDPTDATRPRMSTLPYCRRKRRSTARTVLVEGWFSRSRTSPSVANAVICRSALTSRSWVTTTRRSAQAQANTLASGWPARSASWTLTASWSSARSEAATCEERCSSVRSFTSARRNSLSSRLGLTRGLVPNCRNGPQC